MASGRHRGPGRVRDDLGREPLKGAARRGRGEVRDRAVAGDELAHDLLDPGSALERQLDLDGDLAAIDHDEPSGRWR